MNVHDHLQKLAVAFRADPRNKLFVPGVALLASVREETGRAISLRQLAESLDRFSSGTAGEGDQAVYDGATYICYQAANQCFGNGDEDVDIVVTFLNTHSPERMEAEVRPI